MTNPNPPQELQVVAPQQVQPTEAQPVEQPTPDHVDPVPPEDRILSPEETKNMLFGRDINEPESAEEVVQAEEAQRFFSQVPPEQPGLPQPVADAAVAADQQPQAQPPAAQPAPVQQPLPGILPQPQAPVQPTPTETAQQGQIQMLAQQVQQLTQQLTQQAPQAPQAQAPSTPQQPQQPQQQFNMQVPPEYMNALASEDIGVRTQAMNQLVNGIGNTVYQRAMQDVTQRFEQVTPIVQQQVQAASKQSDMRRDMYGTYPELAGYMDQVAAAATLLENQGHSAQGWSPDLRDMIAERIAPLVPGLGNKVQQVRAARGVVPQQIPAQVPQPQQVLPPQVQGLPPGVTPQAVQGGVHVPVPGYQNPAAPVLVRDAAGNYSQVLPQHQQQLASAQVRPNGGVQADPGLLDMWKTLGF